MLEYTVTEDDIVIVAVDMALDAATAPRLRDRLTRLIDEGRYRLVLDLANMSFIDSIGLGVLVGVVHRLRPHDGSIAVAAPAAQVRDVFEITQLNRVVASYESTEAALTALRAGGPPPGRTL